MSRYTFVLLAAGRVTCHGVDFSGPLRLVKRERDVLVLHCGRGKYWVSLYQPWAYKPAEYHVYRILSERRRGDTTELECERLVAFPARIQGAGT